MDTVLSLVDRYWDVVLGTAVFFSTLFTVFLFTLPSQYDPYSPDFITEGIPANATEQEPGSSYGQSNKPRGTNKTLKAEVSVQIVVLGDIGRSPRMQYHALSVAKHGGRADVIGYRESEVHPDLAKHSRITIVPIAPVPGLLQTSSRLFFLLFAPLKVLWQAWSLYHALSYRTKPAKWMLIQNPPSIPTLAVAQFVCFFRNTNLVIDWHNLGYSILALKLGLRHPFVRVSQWYEAAFARPAAAHLTVTNAMARVLKEQFGITALTLHDRPPLYFQPLSTEQRSSFLSRLPEIAQYAEKVQLGNCKLVVSSTSWTVDEDFSILLDALVEYSAAREENSRLPTILAIITGKGPQKGYYLSKIKTLDQEKQLTNVTILTAWLSAKDYALLLGAADLGVSLHTSSSGVDLPMKVVDMFGAGLPVVGWSDFEAWPELVKEGINGRGFKSAAELRTLLIELFSGDGSSLQQLKDGALKDSGHRWDDEWDRVAGRLFRLVK